MDADSQAVIDKVTRDGTFDEIRQKVVDALKKNEGLKSMVFEMVENSQALSSPDITKLNKRQVLELLRKELEQDLMDHASKAAWNIMSSSDSDVSSYIDGKVHEALCTVYQERRQQAATSTSYTAAAGGYGMSHGAAGAYGGQYAAYSAQGGVAASQSQPTYAGYASQTAYQQQYAQHYSTGAYSQPQAGQAGQAGQSQAYGGMYQQQQQQQQQQQYMQQYSQPAPRGK